MRKVVPFAALAVLAPAVAAAQITLGGSVGLGLPGGNAYEDARTGDRTRMDRQWGLAYPLQLDVLYRLRPGTMIGAYVSYAFAKVGGDLLQTCASSRLSCSSHTFRIGIEGSYRLGPFIPEFFPWVGAAFGWEWTGFTESNSAASVEASFRGPELLILRAGLDYELSEKLVIGPYLSASFGFYTSVLSSASGFPTEHVPIRRTLHEWTSIGIRGRYDL